MSRIAVVRGVFLVGVTAVISGSVSHSAFHMSSEDIVMTLRFVITANAASENRLTA